MDKRLVEPYINSTKTMIKEMAGIDLEIGEPFEEDGDIESLGVTSIINFAGKMRGRFIIDFFPELSDKIVFNMLDEMFNRKEKDYVATISEVNNIITGDANTKINNSLSLGLRLAPPIVFTGNNIIISVTKINSYSAIGNSQYGKMKINIGFHEELK